MTVLKERMQALTHLDLIAVLLCHCVREVEDVLHTLQESLARHVQHAVDIWANREAFL